MITFKHITMRNFLSTGNITQAIDLDSQDLTLVLGDNQDLGGSGNRNGVGKTTVLHAVSYALYGNALNKIRKDNLVNRTNQKGMVVSLEYSSNGIEYKIERGRKPHFLRFYVNNVLQEDKTDKESKDSAQGENRETQTEIDRSIGMSYDMFKYITVLNTYTEPFLSLYTGMQRTIIEQLLGITVLSEKADAIRSHIKINKEMVEREQFRINTIEESNKRVQDQIDALKRRQKMWLNKHNEDLAQLISGYESLAEIDIDSELLNHKKLSEYSTKKTELNSLKSTVDSLTKIYNRDEKQISKLESEISTLESNKCYACGQDFHDENHEKVISDKRALLEQTVLEFTQTKSELEKNKNLISEFGLGECPVTFYKTESQAVEHKTNLTNLENSISSKKAETDPYVEQISDMEQQALQEITFDEMNKLVKLGEHYKFLLDLLTSKDSFVRKKIIDQNLAFLNSRLTYYLDKIGLPHTVVFQNDLSVEITEYGRELDFYNLSRGEMNRVTLALSFAFRDVWENLYHPINTLFIDELIDSGMDQVGVENSISILKNFTRNRNKSVWLVSHRDELVNRVDNILNVIKSGGFTEYQSADSGN